MEVRNNVKIVTKSVYFKEIPDFVKLVMDQKKNIQKHQALANKNWTVKCSVNPSCENFDASLLVCTFLPASCFDELGFLSAVGNLSLSPQIALVKPETLDSRVASQEKDKKKHGGQMAGRRS